MPGKKFCQHDRPRSECKECSARFCEHNRYKVCSARARAIVVRALQAQHAAHVACVQSSVKFPGGASLTCYVAVQLSFLPLSHHRIPCRIPYTAADVLACPLCDSVCKKPSPCDPAGLVRTPLRLTICVSPILRSPLPCSALLQTVRRLRHLSAPPSPQSV